jgi:hypothetical protein
MSLCVAALITVAGIASAQARPSPQGTPPAFDAATVAKLKTAVKKIEKSFAVNQLESVCSQLYRMKDAGLSYDKSLTIPAEQRILVGKTNLQLERLMNMIVVDALYTMYFGKRADAFIELGLALEEKLQRTPANIWKSLLNWNGQPADDKAMTKRQLEYYYRILKEFPNDPEAVRQLVTDFYNVSLEVLYLSAKSGLASGVTPEYRAFLDATLPMLIIAEDIIDSVVEIAQSSNQPDLWRDFTILEDNKVIDSILKVVEKAKGSIKDSDLREMLSIIEKVRAPLAKLAK